MGIIAQTRSHVNGNNFTAIRTLRDGNYVIYFFDRYFSLVAVARLTTPEEYFRETGCKAHYCVEYCLAISRAQIRRILNKWERTFGRVPTYEFSHNSANSQYLPYKLEITATRY